MCVCFSLSSGFLRAGLPGKVFVSQRWELWSHQRSLFLSCWLGWSILQPEWVTGAPQNVSKSVCEGVTRAKGGIREIWIRRFVEHQEHICKADSQLNKNLLGFRIIWEIPARSHMRKHWLGVPRASACITHQTLLISRVHEEVMILFAPLLAACPPTSYGEGCNQTCSCRNDGTCHPASGRCACTPGWTGPDCVEGEWTQRGAKQSSLRQAIEGSKDGFVCMFFSQNALQGFMGQTVDSDACVRMEPPVTRKTENVHAPVDGWARPVNWVRPWDDVRKGLCMRYHQSTFRWSLKGEFSLITTSILFLYFWPSFVKTYSDPATQMLLRQRPMGRQSGDDQTSCKQASFIMFLTPCHRLTWPIFRTCRNVWLLVFIGLSESFSAILPFCQYSVIITKMNKIRHSWC